MINNEFPVTQERAKKLQDALIVAQETRDKEVNQSILTYSFGRKYSYIAMENDEIHTIIASSLMIYLGKIIGVVKKTFLSANTGSEILSFKKITALVESTLESDEVDKKTKQAIIDNFEKMTNRYEKKKVNVFSQLFFNLAGKRQEIRDQNKQKARDIITEFSNKIHEANTEDEKISEDIDPSLPSSSFSLADESSKVFIPPQSLDSPSFNPSSSFISETPLSQKFSPIERGDDCSIDEGGEVASPPHCLHLDLSDKKVKAFEGYRANTPWILKGLGRGGVTPGPAAIDIEYLDDEDDEQKMTKSHFSTFLGGMSMCDLEITFSNKTFPNKTCSEIDYEEEMKKLDAQLNLLIEELR